MERIDLIPITVQEHIKELHVQSELCATKMRVMQAWLDNLLRNEEEMLELWLEVSSVKEEDAVLYIDIIEMLLDPFLRRINTIISKLEAVNNDVINTRELTRLKLDTIQNSVYFANTYINIPRFNPLLYHYYYSLLLVGSLATPDRKGIPFFGGRHGTWS